MRVFVTGASGWIGSAVVPELIGAGHEVIGLARSDASADALVKAGAEVQRGSLDDLDVLRSAAEAADGVIHLAFRHDAAFSGDFIGAARSDRAAIEAFGDALAGSGKPFLIASGLLGLKAGQLATEQDGHGALLGHGEGPAVRLANAELTLSFASRGVRASIVRLPPTVHGDGDNGFMTHVVASNRAQGVSAYVGDGTNRWPAVHVLDAARLFRLGLENAPAGTTLHAIGDEGVPIRDVAEVIGKHLGLPVESISPEAAAAHFTWLAAFLQLDSPASGAATQKLLDWHPTHPGLIDDLELGHYFRS